MSNLWSIIENIRLRIVFHIWRKLSIFTIHINKVLRYVASYVSISLENSEKNLIAKMNGTGARVSATEIFLHLAITDPESKY